MPDFKNVGGLKVGCLWKIGSRESGRESCSQTPTYDTPATAGKQAKAGILATARIPAATETPALSRGHKQEKTQPQQQKRPQQQDLCGKAKSGRKGSQKYSGECGSHKKNLVAVKGPQMAVVLG